MELRSRRCVSAVSRHQHPRRHGGRVRVPRPQGRIRERSQDGETVAHGLARVLGIKPSAEERAGAERRSCPDGGSRIDDAHIRRANFRVSGLRSAVVHSGRLASPFRLRIRSLLRSAGDAARSEFQSRKSGRAACGASALRRTTPGFDNPLYVHGDPRANLLLELALSTWKSGTGHASEALQVITRPISRRVQTRINLCEALVVLSPALGLPHQAAGGLLALVALGGMHCACARAAGAKLDHPAARKVRPVAEPILLNTVDRIAAHRSHIEFCNQPGLKVDRGDAGLQFTHQFVLSL